jgi:outer membrane protein assembly factor BamA
LKNWGDGEFFVLSLKIFSLCFILTFFSSTSFSDEDQGVRRALWVPFAYYTPETSAAFGLLHRVNFSELQAQGRVDQMNLVLSYTAKNQSFVTLASRFYFRGGLDELGLFLSEFDFPDRYYGRGDLGYQDKPDIFSDRRSSIGLSYARHWHDYWYLRLGLSGQSRHLGPSQDVTGLLQTELSTYPQTWSLLIPSVAIEWDSRDFVESPRSGEFVSLGTQGTNEWRRFDGDLRYYRTPDRITWASQIFVGQLWSSSPISFAFLYAVGGRNLARGYPFGYFRDHAVYAFQQEWRWAWRARWNPVWFVQAGGVGDELIPPSRQKLWASAGFGVHYFLDTRARTKLRLEWSRSLVESQFGVYFINAEAF